MDDSDREEAPGPSAEPREVAANLRASRLRAKWRAEAHELQTMGRIKMLDLVTFIERQSSILSDPIYGNIQDASSVRGKPKVTPKPKSKGTFATNVNVSPQEHRNAYLSCMFCNGAHELEACLHFKSKLHKEKIAFLKQNGVCFGCLKKVGHLSKDCPKRLNCSICKNNHPSMLHINAERSVPAPVNSAQVSLRAGEHAGAGDRDNGADCLLSIVPVKVKHAKGSKIIQTYAFLDPGSSATFCTTNLMNKLNLSGRKTNILLRTMSQEKATSANIITGLEVSAIDSREFINLPEVYTQSNMPVSTNSIPSEVELRAFTYLKEVKIPRIKANVELLIGSNAPKALEPWEVINSEDNGPYAVRTVLGWVINGPMQRPRYDGNTVVSANRISVASLEELLMQQYKHDFYESQEERLEMSFEDKMFMTKAEQSVKLLNGHYVLDLPFRNKGIVMPHNYQVAEQRLASLKKKFLKNSQFRAEYTDFLSEVISNEHAELVPENEIERTDGRLWYIPHHGVYHPKKGTLRVVFDCGATYCGTSLNSELLPGPDLTSSLLGVLLRFRQEHVAVMADIQKMFHQVRVTKSDIDFLRFLWWPNGDISKPALQFRMLVHLFGAASSPSCANFALKQAAKDNSDLYHPDIVKTVQCNFYVDDLLKSVSTEQQAIELVKQVSSLCEKGGFHLTKWQSNSKAVIASVRKQDRARAIGELELDRDKLPLERALGLLWSVEEDVFKFNIIVKDRPHTRRNILSTVSSIYDPLGFLSPLILPAKLLLQELCKSKCEWDDRVPQSASDSWQKWLSSLEVLKDFNVSRCLKPPDLKSPLHFEIHHFSDACDHGYGTVSFLRMTTTNKIHVVFMLGKARVAPLKQMTIPRMELTAAVLAAKVDKMLKKEIEYPLSATTFWTDSQSVLKYIANDTTRFHTFVANRISFIRNHTETTQWKYIPTKLNPADMASRGVSASTLVKCKQWLQGPEFLWRLEEEWPQNPMETLSLAQDDPEVKRSTTVFSVVVKEDQTDNPTNQLLEHFSDWHKLKRAVAWHLKFKETLLQKVRNKKISLDMTINIDQPTTLNLVNLGKAEESIVQFCQIQGFAREIKMLKEGKAVSKHSSICKLDPILENGMLCVGGRLNRSAMPIEQKRPVILPKNHHVATLLIRHIHQQLGHSGRNHVLSKLREKYWIVNANSTTRKVLTKCVVCRRWRGKLGEQKMADLPKERLTPDLPPFTNTGVDYFGPFEIKKGRRSLKRYGVIFTCMSSRAVHLEMARSMDTDSCINALRRFVCRRGQVAHIRSDNGTNLVGAKNELQRAITEWNIHKIQSVMLQRGVEWSFNPPAASHHGGVWERLIRMVRQVLYSILKQQLLDDESLETLLCEVESILNSRPITTVKEDGQDVEALTPNHILLLNTQPVLPPGLFSKSDQYTRRRWRQVQYLADLFWKRWTQEYLPMLQERQKWFRVKRGFQRGDVVLIVDNTAPRGSWPLGRVTEVRADSKGLARSLTIRTKTGFLERPITKVCLLLEGSEDPDPTERTLR
ncbi:uncharacterized protein LOC118556656 isoform X5 [Fundulus heteroclitus]|uniref:uncharacterized protein LOC118556656 isoform X5 n=1 Tax=Fundulus heteroclitus TaxID=8078 RepID=UPI00165CC988|nr:uncharacterized protein LOC118556656 isoform X5 [Fundulus heteroclitus]